MIYSLSNLNFRKENLKEEEEEIYLLFQKVRPKMTTTLLVDPEMDLVAVPAVGRNFLVINLCFN